MKTTVQLENKDVREIIAKFLHIPVENVIPNRYTTVGGFCQDILDRFAKKGDEFDFAHYHFIVLEADEFTVEKLKVIDNEFEKEE